MDTVTQYSAATRVRTPVDPDQWSRVPGGVAIHCGAYGPGLGGQQDRADPLRALARCWQYALPIEQERAQRACGTSSGIGKVVILEKEMARDRVTLVLVGERPGY